MTAQTSNSSLPVIFPADTLDLNSESSYPKIFTSKFAKIIGKGATARVRLMGGKGNFAGKVFAVKEFRLKKLSETENQYHKRVISEYTIASKAQHPNIVQTFMLCNHKGHWNQVMEFCENGDLFKLISQKYLSRKDRLIDRVCLFKQLIYGLNYLHVNGIAHRDVKPENLLITQRCKLKITDFGISEVSSDKISALRFSYHQKGHEIGKLDLRTAGRCGSPPYMAPEVIATNEEYDGKPLDVWAAAIVMLCMIANGVLWPEAKAGSSPLYDKLIMGWANWETRYNTSLREATCHETGLSFIKSSVVINPIKSFSNSRSDFTSENYPSVAFFENYVSPPTLRRMLLFMLNPNPRKRISISEIISSHWFHSLECCQLDILSHPNYFIDARKGKCFSSNGKVCEFQKIARHDHLPKQKNSYLNLIKELLSPSV